MGHAAARVEDGAGTGETTAERQWRGQTCAEAESVVDQDTFVAQAEEESGTCC